MATSQQYWETLDKLCQPVRMSDYPRSLSTMHSLLDALGRPQQHFPSVVVAGSVGKGTACHNLAEVLHASGLRVGLYTSPHLHVFRERFAIDNTPISHEQFVEAAEFIHLVTKRLNQTYSTFEQSTALALWWFAQQEIDIAVLEIGLGGRLDAVNAVENSLAIITRIEGEHMDMLGGSRWSVAWHKAGIIRPNGHVITARQSSDVFAVIMREAEQQNAHLHTDGGSASGLESGTVLALAAWQNLMERQIIPRSTLTAPFEFSTLPGRLEQVSLGKRLILLDGGHTGLSARLLRHHLDRMLPPPMPIRLVVGMLGDKDAAGYLKTFDTQRFRITLTNAPSHRAAAPETLRSQANLVNARVSITASLDNALDLAHIADESAVVVSGSLRMVAAARETYGLLDGETLAEAQATRAVFDGDRYLAKIG